jgi:hypothetical protein
MNNRYFLGVHFSGIVTCQRDVSSFVTQEHVIIYRSSGHTSGRNFFEMTR